ncbi:MAG TPA: MBL fold metallo-hydrolase [Vicinamibacterales bacterium]|nr:MBL fold metallo-hydrolase [Vicinamibacterales bacterium]HOQ60383.1 MBL fold metallo-hydrolase [Vicinamibacterales bacterium]HPK70871.1 MBL fold metallo-hydrolase [Vicinamibacterales bacterium]
MTTLTFLGAAGTVTGSKYLLETGGRRLLVDCGLFQGLKELRERNWEPLPLDPKALDAVILTHAHIDHSGYLPRLVKDGFKRRVFCTPATADLCRIMLPDSGRLNEDDARDANRDGYTKHAPALPLFTENDAYEALTRLQPVGYERTMPLDGAASFSFADAGHLLGSSFVRLSLADRGREILFSGDLGRYGRPVLPDPSTVPSADVLVVESTYGDRTHERDDGGAKIAEIVSSTIAAGGKVIIPAFAVGRVEEVIYWLKRLEEERRIPVVPVYLDSPMAVDALRHYASHSRDLDPDVQSRRGEMGAFTTRRFTAVASPQQSKEIQTSPSPCVVVSASGMATGGRVLHHLKAALPRPRNTVLFVGYQAAGTRGRSLIEGAQTVKIHGQQVSVAARIERIDSMSAHADADEILRWLGGFRRPPETTYIVHGEPPARAALKARIERELGWRVHVPEHLERVVV